MINKLLYKLTAGLKCRLIARTPGERYLERYYLGELFGVTFYLHRFVPPDAELHVHNHPWTRGASVVLCGGYVEEVATDICPHAGPSGCTLHTRLVRWFNTVDGATFHRIKHAEHGTWTLFMHGARARVGYGGASKLKGWGFLSAGPGGTTVFTPFPPSTNLEWWHGASTGRFIGRAPL